MNDGRGKVKKNVRMSVVIKEPGSFSKQINDFVDESKKKAFTPMTINERTMKNKYTNPTHHSFSPMKQIFNFRFKKHSGNNLTID